MRTVTSIVDLIGHTPMLRLAELEPPGGAELWAKLEAYNPGFSVKDRVGLALVRAAEADGRLRAGGTIVEATAGNTGLALASSAAAYVNAGLLYRMLRRQGAYSPEPGWLRVLVAVSAACAAMVLALLWQYGDLAGWVQAPALVRATHLGLLIGLGVWQLQRSDWKQGLVDANAARAALPAVELRSW